jgi:hypothetical protein
MDRGKKFMRRQFKGFRHSRARPLTPMDVHNQKRQRKSENVRNFQREGDKQAARG